MDVIEALQLHLASVQERNFRSRADHKFAHETRDDDITTERLAGDERSVVHRVAEGFVASRTASPACTPIRTLIGGEASANCGLAQLHMARPEGKYAPVAACGHRPLIVQRAAGWRPLVLGLCISACSAGVTLESTAPPLPLLTIADPAVDFCEPIATSRFAEFVAAFNHRDFALADAMITQGVDFRGFAEAPDRRADAVPPPDRSTVREFLESRASIDEFWRIEAFAYEPYQATLARPGSFISFAIQVSNDTGVVLRDGKGFIHCATDRIDNFILGPTAEENAN